jgi:hypothetical protein
MMLWPHHQQLLLLVSGYVCLKRLAGSEQCSLQQQDDA